MKLRLIGLTGWLLFCFLFITFIHLSYPLSAENILASLDGTQWMFLFCLIGASLFTLLKRKFNLFSENLTSVSRDVLIFVAAIPFIGFAVELCLKLIEKFVYGKTHSYGNWVSEYLIELIVQSMVCLSCISYFYVSALIKTKERLAEAQRAQSEMQLKLLQQKVDPHFLFNNLNVLSSLVEKNPKSACEFLSKLAELYRYILHTQNTEIVSLKDELEFAENYLYLLKQRFGEAYNFDWRVTQDKINGQMIVPAALQSLIENVVKHNGGSRRKPLQVRIELEKDFLIVENQICAKSLMRPATSGTGLQNLAARYAFLTERPVDIQDDKNVFSVRLPLLELKK